MKPLLLSLLACAFLPSYAAGAPQPATPRAYFGVVADEVRAEASGTPVSPDPGGLRVSAVAADSPAARGGIRPGDMVVRVGGRPVGSRQELMDVVRSHEPGVVVPVEVMRGNARQVINVALDPRPASLSTAHRPSSAVGGDRVIRPVAVPSEIRDEMRHVKQRIVRQLALLPDEMEPRSVIRDLQEIRDLARDANAGRQGWMTGRAGEATVLFKDPEGGIVLRGANNLITIEVYDASGRVIYRAGLNTPAERRALPSPLLQRLRSLR